MMRIAVGAALTAAALLAAGSAEAYGTCEPVRYCPEWRAECVSEREPYCDFRDGCYYGPAEPPPRHKWRPREFPAREKPVWRSPERIPPLPSRRPATVTAGMAKGGTPRTRRQQAAADGKIPERYREATNDIGHTLTAIEAGAPLYREHCAACHGVSGEGDGPKAQEYEDGLPSLPYTLARDDSTDAYLIWTIMEGGEPVGTDKPAFKGELGEDQAWRIIAYMRAGFPGRGPSQPIRQTMRAKPISNTDGDR